MVNKMNIILKPLEPCELELFRKEMKKSFEQGVLERFGDISAAPTPPTNEVDFALKDATIDVFLLMFDNVPVGGTIIKRENNNKFSLDLFFIFKDYLNKKLGSAAWQAIEANYPKAELWETHTPYFERRNIHFYVNKCGFKIVEFFSEFHTEEHDITEEFKDINTSGFFRFEKRIKQ